MCVSNTSDNQVMSERTTTTDSKVKDVLNPGLSLPGTDGKEGDEPKYEPDALAVSTHFTKLVFAYNETLIRRFKNSNLYKVLCETTQPAHVVTTLAVSFVAFSLYPNRSKQLHVSTFWTLLYLGCFSLHFGAQIWMTFVSGLSLYFNMPRHIFGEIQRVLFPKYFLLNAVLSFITLAIFLRSHNADLMTPHITVQAVGMVTCFIIELLLRLYLTPPLLRLIEIKTAIEKDAGLGMEIGKLEPGRLCGCPHYMRIHFAFRRVHMTIAIGNIITMSCTLLHLHYLAAKLCSL